MKSSIDLILVVVLAAAALVVALVGVAGPPRAALALPLVLVLTGYAVLAAALGHERLGLAELLVLSLGSSLALAALSGFALNLLPQGLQTGTWAAWLGGLTFVASGIAFARRRGRWPAGRLPRVGLRAQQWVLLGLALLTVGGALGLAHASAVQQHSHGFTQLWVLPPHGTEGPVVRLGIDSRELVPTQYRLRLAVEDDVVREWPAIELAPGGRWETTLALDERENGTLAAELYRASAPEALYRRVVWRPRATATPAGVNSDAAESDEEGQALVDRQ